MEKNNRMSKIKQFIEDNKLDFTGSESELNSNCCILAGYSLHIGFSNSVDVLKDLDKNITLDLFDVILFKKVFRYLSKYIIVMNTIFKALNDETRREILELLRKKEMSAGDIADVFTISKPSISHHLDLLKQAELEYSEKNGQFITYSLNTTILEDVMKWIINLKK